MELIFTDYVRALEPGEDPSAERFETLWRRLRSALVAELRKRSLWDAPPSYLGIYGGGSWSQGETLEELLLDCYAFVFVDRLEGLKAQLAMRENVEGLVFRNIRNFLYTMQKKHDPLGFRVFQTLQTAVRQAIDAERIYVLAGDPKIRNDTVLGFAPWLDAEELRRTDLDEAVKGWGGELLPELVTARGNALEETTASLCSCLVRLESKGVELFRFKEVVDPLKQEVRAHWRTLWQQTEGETGFEDGGGDLVRLVRLVRPDCGFEERQSFQCLLVCVAEAVAAVEGLTDKTRGYLHKLWVFLRSQVAEDQEDRLPAKQKIAAALGIPRYRLPELLDILGSHVEACSGQRTKPLPPPVAENHSVLCKEARP